MSKFLQYGVRIKIHGDLIAIEYNSLNKKQLSVINSILQDNDIYNIVTNNYCINSYRRIKYFKE
jgi:hypothetical protein